MQIIWRVAALKDLVTNIVTHSNLTIPQISLKQRSEVELIDETSCTQSDIMFSGTFVLCSRNTADQKKVGIRFQRTTANLQRGAIMNQFFELCHCRIFRSAKYPTKNADNMFCQSLVPTISTLPAKMNSKN